MCHFVGCRIVYSIQEAPRLFYWLWLWRLSFRDKFRKSCEERANAKAKAIARQRTSDDEVVELTYVVQQDSALNPNVQ